MTTVIISYNNVKGFTSGWHGGDKLFICANDQGRGSASGSTGTEQQRAGSTMHRISHQYYDGEVPVNNVTQYIVYAGLNALHGAIDMAIGLWQHAPDVPILVVACSCDWTEKTQRLEGTGIGLQQCECGGSKTLAAFARAALDEE